MSSVLTARPMTRAERKEFQAAGMDPRRNATKLTAMRDSGDGSGVAELSDAMEDWILDHIYKDQLPDDITNPEASKLAMDTYFLTFGIKEEDLKN